MSIFFVAYCMSHAHTEACKCLGTPVNIKRRRYYPPDMKRIFVCHVLRKISTRHDGGSDEEEAVLSS
jgi:hypothetical protein